MARPKATVAPGWSSSASSCAASFPGSQMSSASASATSSVSSTASPAARAAAGPRGPSSRRTSWTSSLNSSGGCDPSSTTTTTSGAGSCPSTDSSASVRYGAGASTGRMTPTPIVRESGAYAWRPMATLADTDWLDVCRRACDGVRAAMARFPSPSERAVPTGRGEGGDIALVIDRAAEDAIFAELESLGLPLTVVSEERGHVDLNGGGQTRLIVDPIDGSRNAKRGIPAYSVSIAVAGGPAIGDVIFGYVYDLALDEEWHAARGHGAWLGDHRLPQLPADGELEMLGMEMIHPGLL